MAVLLNKWIKIPRKPLKTAKEEPRVTPEPAPTKPTKPKHLDLVMTKGAKLPPGTRRNWGGKEYIKTVAGKWRRYVVEKDNAPVQYEGEFVLTSDGNKDFGEISPEIAQTIRRQAGKIRLRVGEQDTSSERGYGEKHIERPKRFKEIKSIGFTNARDFVAYIAENYDAIYEEPSEDSGFWDVKTAYSTRKDSKRNKKPLWERTQSG
jgi:hypothetical protein